MQHQAELFSFLNQGASPFHAVAAAEAMLQEAGAVYLPEQKAWDLQAHKLYYTKRNGSSIIAFVAPEQELSGYRVTASHSDVPTWRIKTLAGQDKYYAKAEVEGYGGMIMSTWLDRPLSFAGRVLVRVVREGAQSVQIESRLVHPNRALFCIPNVAIHFNREINTGYKFNPQIDLQPIFGAAGGDLNTVLANELSLGAGETIVAHDLVLCPVQEATALGIENEFFMSPRIDDLECAYTTLAGFLATARQETAFEKCNVWAMFDNEEVGSSSRQGAEGSFLQDVLVRVEEALALTESARVQVRANSLLLSADNGHAVHPNHPEKSDPEHPITLGGGVVLKYNASQRYTTNGFTAALFTEICNTANVKTQVFYNRADIAGGGTLGNLLSHQISIPMVDIGLAQLAMHAAVETASLADAEAMISACTAFYSSRFAQTEDGIWELRA